MNVLSNTLHACVFSRTASGRRAVIDPMTTLSDPQWRLLLMVNGETPFADLVDLAPAIEHADVVGPLLYEGLIEPLEREAVINGRPQVWRAGH